MMFMLLNCLPEAGEVCLADGELLLDDVLPVGGVDVDAVQGGPIGFYPRN